MIGVFMVIAELLLSVTANAEDAGYTGDDAYHVIVLVHRRGTMYPLEKDGKTLNVVGEAMETLIRTELAKLCFTPDEVEESHALLRTPNTTSPVRQPDYLSVAYFGLEGGAKDFQDFIRPIASFYLWKQDYTTAVFSEVWSQILTEAQAGRKIFSSNWGAQTWAIPVALGALNQKHSNQPIRVQKTFVVLITNDKWNVGGAQSEQSLIAQSQSTDFIDANHKLELWMSNFKTEPLLKYMKIINSIQLQVYEVQPQVDTSVLASWLPQQNDLTLQRDRMSYTASFAVHPDEYTLYKPDSPIIQIREKNQRAPLPFGLAEIPFPSTYADDQLEVCVKITGRFAAELYGVHLLPPQEKCIPLRFEAEQKVLTWLPVSEMMWNVAAKFGFKTQHAVVWFWNVGLTGMPTLCLGLIGLSLYNSRKRKRTRLLEDAKIVTNDSNIPMRIFVKKGE